MQSYKITIAVFLAGVLLYATTVLALKVHAECKTLKEAYANAYWALQSDDVKTLSENLSGALKQENRVKGNDITLLFTAINRSDKHYSPATNCIRYLIESGADLNKGPIVHGVHLRPIIVCHTLGPCAHDVAKLLIENGASFHDDEMTDRYCLCFSLPNRGLFDYYLSCGARYDMFLERSPIKADNEKYKSSLLEEALFSNGVDLAMLKYVHELLPSHIQYVNPVGLVETFYFAPQSEKENQVEKLKYILEHGVERNAVFTSRVYGSKCTGTLLDFAIREEAHEIVDLLKSLGCVETNSEIMVGK